MFGFVSNLRPFWNVGFAVSERWNAYKYLHASMSRNIIILKDFIEEKLSYY